MKDEIHSNFFRESRSFYNLKSLSERLEITEEEGKKIISRLRSANIIKPTMKQSFDMEKLQDTEEIITDERIFSNYENGFTFNFVGIAYTENCILKCYPKYIDDETQKQVQQDKLNLHFKKVLRTIQKYNDEKQVSVPIFNGMEKDGNFNRLAVELYLLRDYYTNGIYTNQKTIIETNGEGLIDWDRTINETFAIIKNNNPYYIDLQTVEFQDNVQDFFRQLHECILTKCSEELEQLGLLDLFDIAPVKLNPMSVSDFGTVDYIKYRIEQEIRNQFVTKKQNLLKTLYVFISETESSTIQDNFSFFGTNAFNMVWEKASSAIFDDVKDKKIDELERAGKIKFDLYQPKDRKKNLLDLIEKASWVFDKKYTADDTLLPDIITIENNTFHILDGKYYLIQIKDGKIHNQPGIQDVVKQFAYHKVYYNLLQFSNLTHVSNSFLVPKLLTNDYDWSDVNIRNIGHAELNLMQSFTMETLCPINVVQLHPEIVYNAYLNDKKITDELNVISATEIVKNVGLTSYDWKNDYIPMLNFTVVGFLRKGYMDKIKENGIGEKFYFYFYRKINNSFLPVQNLIPCCQYFIGRNESSDFMVQAKITEGVKTVTKKDLDLLLEKNGFEKTTNPKVSEYYVIEMKTTGFDVVKGIDEKIKEFEENMILSDYSPKVIMLENGKGAVIID